MMIRKTFAAGDKKRDAGLTTPEGIQRYDNILYSDDPKWNLLDVYRPKTVRDGCIENVSGTDHTGSEMTMNTDDAATVKNNSEDIESGVPPMPEKLPVIVIVHGGGWVYGTKEVYQFYGMSLAQRGFAVVNSNYRLAPEHKFPAGMTDTNKVFQWVMDHAEEYGFDTARIFAVGDSAGGQMLSIYAAICTNPDYAAIYPFSIPSGMKLRGIALNCGVYEIPKESKSMDAHLMKDLLGKNFDKAVLEKLSPLNYITENYPPSFVMTAEGDQLVGDKPENLLQALETHRIHYVYRHYGDEEHKIGHVFHCNIRLPEATLCNDDECSWFLSL